MQKSRFRLNAIGRHRKYIGFPEKKAFIEAFVNSNFNFFNLALYLHEIHKQIDSIQERALRLLYNDYTSTYDSLLAKANKPSMEIKRY